MNSIFTEWLESASRSVSRPLSLIDAVNKALMKLLTSQILLSFRMERTGGSGDVPRGEGEPVAEEGLFVCAVAKFSYFACINTPHYLK